MAAEKCFIIAPISTLPERAPLYLNDVAHCEHIIDHLLAPAAAQAGFEPIKPKVKGANVIHAEIVQNLQTASLVLCDMSGLNPNVFFELGIRTAMNKPVCLTIDEATKDPPFDLDLVNHHSYLSDLRPWVLPGEVEKLASHIRESASNKENALWKYFSLRVKADVAAWPGPVDKLDLLVTEFDALRKQITDANTLARQEAVRAVDWAQPVETRPAAFARAEMFGLTILKEAKARGIVVRKLVPSGHDTITLVVSSGAEEAIERLRTEAARHGIKLNFWRTSRQSMADERSGTASLPLVE